MTHASEPESPAAKRLPDRRSLALRGTLLPTADRPILVFAVVLAVLLVGYMFMGRGFAHLGVGPLYVGDWALILGLGIAAFVAVRTRRRPAIDPAVALLLAFMAFGAARTVPYLGQYGLDALRDAVIWGYGFFALLVVYLFGGRDWLRAGARAYALVIPLFAIWLPIAWQIFRTSQAGVDVQRPGSNHPLVFFKAGDMAVHATAAIAFVVLAPGLLVVLRAAIARFFVAIPLSWTLFLTGSASRGAILAATAGVATAAIASRRLMPWVPIVSAALVVVVALSVPDLVGYVPPSETGQPTASGSLGPSGSGGSAAPTETAVPPPSPAGRVVTPEQWVENVSSIFGTSSMSELDGTKAFRLAWWKAIVDYTVFGPYLWSGKGFGINLADADGFQPTLDHSLRAPHNSHLTVLARMGVPGFALWALFNAAFAIGLLRLALVRRGRDPLLALTASWVLVVWTAMMVVTSFDPFLEGPQGGIWFWVVVGIGLVVTRLDGTTERT